MTAPFIVRATAAQNTLRLIAIEVTEVVEEARLRHHLSKTATAALGRTLAASGLLAVALGKHAEARVAIRIEGGGTVGAVVAEGSYSGELRGYVSHPEADLPPRERDGKLDVSGIVGVSGEITVTRLNDNGEPYTGSVPLRTGEIAEDVSYYLGASEQIPNAVLLGVYEEAGKVAHAGGVLVQAMPGVSDTTLEKLEQNVVHLGMLTDQMRQGGLLQVLELLGKDLDLVMAAEATEVRWQCRCSREKALDSLKFFDETERLEMQEAGGQEVWCHWCNEHYQLTPAEIAAL